MLKSNPRWQVALLLLLLASGARGEGGPSVKAEILGRGDGDAYVFAFFYGGEDAETRARMQTLGMWMAISKDGLDWKVVNDNEVVFERPCGKVFRDPMISQGPDGVYHLVWTIAWDGETSIGYARSTDLIHWEDVRRIDVMGSVEGTNNVWAPELFRDRDNGRWMIYWASSVKGRFPETATKKKYANNRMYCCFTTDFVHLTEPQLLLDAHIVNDCRIVNYDSPWGNYCMVVKHIKEPGSDAELYLAYSEDLAGPYVDPFDATTTHHAATGIGPDANTHEYISRPYRFCEGPAVIKIDGWYYCYFDLSREEHMACKRARQLLPGSWQDMTGRLTFPEQVKHGDVIRVPKEIYDQLDALSRVAR